MDFLKKNGGKIAIAVVALAGVVITLIPLVTSPEFKFVAASQVIGPFLFFVGLFAFICLKMFGKTKAYSKFVALGIGLLVIVFMAVGATGISKEQDKYKGVFGASYYLLKDKAANGETSLAAAEAQLTGVQAQLTGVNQLLTGVNAAIDAGATTVGQLEALNPTLYGALAEKDFPDVAPLTTVKTALETGKTQLEAGKAQLEAGIAAAPLQIDKANWAADAIMYTYIAMIIALGAIPFVYGTTKAVCCCCKEKETTTK